MFFLSFEKNRMEGGVCATFSKTYSGRANQTWFIDNISVLFVCLHTGLVSALLSIKLIYITYSKTTIKKEFRKSTWS